IHGKNSASRYRMAFSPNMLRLTTIAAQPIGESQPKKRAGLDTGSLPYLICRTRSGGGSLGSNPAGFNPRIDLRLQEPDPAPSVPRKANPLRKPVVVLPTPQRLPRDMKLLADLLHRIEPIH